MGAILELLWSSVMHVDWMPEPLTDFHEESKETAHILPPTHTPRAGSTNRSPHRTAEIEIT